MRKKRYPTRLAVLLLSLLLSGDTPRPAPENSGETETKGCYAGFMENAPKFMSPAALAKRAGVSRPTVTKAINNGALDAHRDNRGHWQITTESAEKWLKAHEKADTETTVQDSSIENTELIAKISRLEAELQGKVETLAAKDETIERMQSEIDHLRSLETIRTRRRWWPFS